MTNREKLAAEVDALMTKLMDDGCADAEMLRLVDRVARRTLHGLHHAWVRWDFYVAQTLFSPVDRYVAYDMWAKMNCESA